MFRKSKRFGPFRITAGKRGLSFSAGVPGARLSINSRGEVRESAGVPGSGLYIRNKIGQIGGSPDHDGGRTESGPTEIHDVVDATGGTRALLDHQEGVAQLAVVGVDPTVDELARMAGIGTSDNGPWVRGIRDAVLRPQTDGYGVIVMITRADNPKLYGRRDDDTPKAMIIGRLGKRDLTKWQDRFAGRPIKVVVYLDASPGYTHRAEVRFRPELLTESEPNTSSGLTPPPDAG
jgi:hypothetical protein